MEWVARKALMLLTYRTGGTSEEGGKALMGKGYQGHSKSLGASRQKAELAYIGKITSLMKATD